MRRTPAVMVMVAAWVITGCATVDQQHQQPGGPEPASGSRVPVFPLPSDSRITPPPAREALATVLPEPASGPPASAPAAVPRASAAAAPEAVSRERPGAASPEPAATPHRNRPGRPAGAALPPLPRPVNPLPGGAGVCSLGEVYGGWAGNSDADRICRQTYGR